MPVKVMGIATGGKNSNKELLLKEALIHCEQVGVEIIMIEGEYRSR